MGLFFLAFTLLAACTPYEDYTVIISHYDAQRAYQGNTYFQTHVWSPGYFIVDMEGNILWHRAESGALVGYGIGLDVLDNGNVLTMPENSTPTLIDPETDEILWTATGIQGHHTVAWTPWGSAMTLVSESIVGEGFCTIASDRIVDIDVPSGEIIWEWPLHEYVDPYENSEPGFCDHAFAYEDWSHCNTVKVIENYVYKGKTYPAVVLLLSRNLDTFWMIDYSTKEIIWSCGQHGTFGRREPPLEPLFDTAHEIEMTDAGTFLLFDNGANRAELRSRALEFEADPVAGTTTALWAWTEPSEVMYLEWGGDADRLPNGNTLVSNVAAGRIVEVAPNGDKVWQLDIRPPGWILPPEATSPISVFMAKRPAVGDL